ncbi:aldo/keto reductase [Nonomuraea aurantiaca]|uniref:aldo/keto reductase n=1 Tax=Nonomuraea aurantiaca TaxID=2878562 RepID=UPI0021E6A3D2|nr:aldo/keto reductase [Nonomuraea aurantiaca]
MYGAGESEQFVGKTLQGRRDDVILATKVHFQMVEGRNRGGDSRRWIIKEAEESLRRLQTDWIDLYQIYRPDHSTVNPLKPWRRSYATAALSRADEACLFSII